jgi:hypothetical protein
MKKIILSTVAVLAVLWVAVFVSGQQVLVWESQKSLFKIGGFVPDDQPNSTEECTILAKKIEANPFDCFDEYLKGWQCTYFNGRRFITKNYSSSRTSCPNFRKNQ